MPVTGSALAVLRFTGTGLSLELSDNSSSSSSFRPGADRRDLTSDLEATRRWQASTRPSVTQCQRHCQCGARRHEDMPTWSHRTLASGESQYCQSGVARRLGLTYSSTQAQEQGVLRLTGAAESFSIPGLP